jgi:hypothetical protein
MSRKIRPLPITDFARYATLPPPEMEQRMRLHSDFVPDVSLEAFRNALFDICNVQPAMFEFKPSAWADVEARIRELSKKKPDSETLCQTVGKALWMHCSEKEIYSIQHDVSPVPLGMGMFAKFWHDFYMVVDKTVLFPFFDARLSASLGDDGRRFAASFQKEFLATGRFSNARLAVFSFPRKGKARGIKLHEFQSDELFSKAQLDEMIQRAVEMWAKISEEREPVAAKPDPRQGEFKFG